MTSKSAVKMSIIPTSVRLPEKKESMRSSKKNPTAAAGSIDRTIEKENVIEDGS